MASDCTKHGIWLRDLLETMLARKASDLHVIPGIPSHVRTMNQSLFSLYRTNLISEERALEKSSCPDELIQMMRNHDH